MLSMLFLTLVAGAAEPQWHTDYLTAFRQACRQHKDLVIHFEEGDHLGQVFDHSYVEDVLGRYVCLRVPASYEYDGKRLLDYPALADMLGRPGLAVVSCHDPDLPFYQEVVSAHPVVGSRYHWVPGYGVNEVRTILELPPDATLSQRSMIYAIRVHPERPQSVYARGHFAFFAHAQRHSFRQAGMLRQHHADIIGASNRLQGETGDWIGGASEVVAESWGRVVGGENVLEACFSCVDAWRHSPGHWGAVSRAHRYFGYDIAQGANGTWYATGIFAD
jgi:hypothetical protein